MKIKLIALGVILLVGVVCANFALTHRFVIRHSRLPAAAQYFGTDGYEVIGDFAKLPPYAEVQVDGATNYLWEQSTTDVRALQKATDPTNVDRIAACWYSGSYMDIGINITDGQPHQVALYFLDWYSMGRVETVEAHDWATGNLLDTRTISNFSTGVYAIYNITGHVYFHIARVSGDNAVISGIFFQPVGTPPAPTPTPTAIPTPTPTPTPTPIPNGMVHITTNADGVGAAIQAQVQGQIQGHCTISAVGECFISLQAGAYSLVADKPGYTFTVQGQIVNVKAALTSNASFMASPVPTPTPTPTPLPWCASGERPGNPPHCRCRNGFAGNSGKCR